MRFSMANMFFSSWEIHICHLRHVTNPVLKLKYMVDDLAKLDKIKVLVQNFKQV